MNAPSSDNPPPDMLPVLWDEAPPRAVSARGLTRLLGWVAGLFVVLLVLAATIPIGGAVIAPGQVVADSRIKRVAHPTGGVIDAILVRNGDHVAQGQILIRLDDRVIGAEARYADRTVVQLLAQKARIEAEQLGRGTIVFPPELVRSPSPEAARAMADETRLLALRRAEEGGMRAQLDARAAQYSEEIHGIEAQIAAQREQRALIERERAGVRDLWDRQLVTISRLNQLERGAVDLDGSIGALQAQIAQARARITETREQAIQLGQARRAAAGNELDQINAALAQQLARQASASDSNDRATIRAPYAGTVEHLAFAAAGDVIRPAEPILEIVPDRDAMVVEAMIAPADIDHVHAGMIARVRFSGFNRAATPEIDGTVITVATDRTDNAEARQAYFSARIALDAAALRRERLTLKNGMTAEVHVSNGSRSLLSYLMKPLADQFARAFRDN